jgi:acylphosphatase
MKTGGITGWLWANRDGLARVYVMKTGGITGWLWANRDGLARVYAMKTGGTLLLSRNHPEPTG